MTRSPVTGYRPSPPRARRRLAAEVVAYEGMWQGDSLAPMAAMALEALDRRIAADRQRLLNEALIIDDDREAILQEIVLPILLRIHSKTRLRSELALAESFNSQPIAAAIKGIFFDDRIKERALTNAAIRKTIDQFTVIVNLIGQHMEPGETLLMTNGHVGRHHTAEEIRVGNQLLRNEDKGVLRSDPRSKINLLLSALRCLILLFCRVSTSNGAEGAKKEIHFFEQLMPGWGEVIYDFRWVVQNMFKREREVAGCDVLLENHIENCIPPPLKDAILDVFVVTHPRALSRANWKSPGVHEGQLLLAEPRPESEDHLDRLNAHPRVCNYETSFDFGDDVESAPWTAAMLLKNTIIPEDLTIARGDQGAKPRVGDQRLKNAHIILSRCGFPMHVDMVLQHYNNKN